MKKNKMVGVLALMMLGSSTAFAAENQTADFQASAEIENFCSVEVDNVNFGQVTAPLSAQGSKSEMRVLCSKNAPYSVNLLYGVNGGTVSSGASADQEYKFHAAMQSNYLGSYSGYYSTFFEIAKVEDSFVNNYRELVDFECSTKDINQVRLISEKSLSLFGKGGQPAGWYNMPGVCSSNSMYEYPRINAANLNSTFASFAVKEFGTMIGAIRGDSLAYKITLPGDNTKVWSSGINEYQAVGDGESQKIDINAQIVPNKSSSQYLAQDSYIDTVTAVISY